MYFRALDQLKDWNEDELEIFDKALKNIFDRRWHTRFSPNIYRILPMLSTVQGRRWQQLLTTLQRNNFIHLTYEIECSECYSSHCSFSKLRDIPQGQDFSCIHCGETVEYSPDHIFLVYNFDQHFYPQKDITENPQKKKLKHIHSAISF